jgi:hypothetical protein
MRTGLVGMVVVLALLVGGQAAIARPGASPARTFKLGWTEHYRDGNKQMTFVVHSLTLRRDSWTARVSFRNNSRYPYMIIGGNFQLMVYGGVRPKSCNGYQILEGNRFTPKLGDRLAPGARWTGTIGGDGAPPLRRYLRLALGAWGGLGRGIPVGVRWSWLTDHTVSAQTGRSVLSKNTACG